MEFTNIGSPTLLSCGVHLATRSGAFVDAGAVKMTGSPAAGTYRSPVLGTESYVITAYCIDADGVTMFSPNGPIETPVKNYLQNSSSDGSSGGSTETDRAMTSVESLFAS
ncbi:hypothetical protein [Rhodococcus tukisamuensis]|uniref:hypothetical protein n=1 Tax=Rhodococcus tukisamuensis TaxID=168276 RepID=UPI0011149CB8|nr:hypothetical protein [Rhodococcus tukisamuensis]